MCPTSNWRWGGRTEALRGGGSTDHRLSTRSPSNLLGPSGRRWTPLGLLRIGLLGIGLALGLRIAVLRRRLPTKVIEEDITKPALHVAERRSALKVLVVVVHPLLAGLAVRTTIHVSSYFSVGVQAAWQRNHCATRDIGVGWSVQESTFGKGTMTPTYYNFYTILSIYSLSLTGLLLSCFWYLTHLEAMCNPLC